MIQEIYMTPGEAWLFVVVGIFLMWKIWHFEAPKKDEKPGKTAGSKEDAREQLNPDYGAYIQLAGRRNN